MIQRAVSIALSIAAVVLSAVLAFNSASRAGEHASAAGDAGEAASKTGAASTATSNGTSAPAPTSNGTSAPTSSATSPTLPEAGFPDLLGDAPLPANTPRHVRFGVVLVTYEGAEGAEHGARTKSAAAALAEKLADEAKSDFHSAVQHGDSGSADDVGRIHCGVLEPSSEAVVFALPVGQTSGVVDTPRGFWIVKRLE